MRGGARSILAVFVAISFLLTTLAVAAAGSGGPAAAGALAATPPVVQSPPTSAAVGPGPAANPVAMFTARQDRMTTTLDASGSYSAPGSTITSYAWDFGDGTSGGAVRTSHTYTTPGRYTVRLDMQDSLGRTGNGTRFVSPADTTVDILADQFFQAECPYAQYWLLRKDTYGDTLLQNKVPCTDYYPWVYFSSAVELQKVNPSFVYTLYRFDARVRNHPAYNLSEPVILPVFDRSVPPASDSYIQLNLTFNYLSSALIDQLDTTPFAVNSKYSDGFGFMVQGNITMDLTMSKRIFGVPKGATPAQAQAWWLDESVGSGTAPKNPGPVETKFGSWLESLGNGKYDIYNGFEWFYESDITWLNATVDLDGTTHVKVFLDGWGYDVLMARWWYWGNASYRDAVNAPYGAVQPRGWMPMETCSCEQAKINGRITSSLDLNFQAIQEYHFRAWANWGPDGIPGTKDDLPAWVFAPILMDYVPRQGSGSPAAEGYPNSELRWYEGFTSVHGSPGSYAYGQAYEYMNPPTRWPLNTGSTLTLILPRFNVTWYDPVRSTWNPTTKVGDYVTFDSPMTLRQICSQGATTPSGCTTAAQGDYYIWDSRAKTISMAGPYDWGTKDLPRQPAPWIEFAPEAYGASLPPVASFNYSPAYPVVGQRVTFDASSSFDPNGTITSYAWDFGDGATAAGVVVNHSYQYQAYFTVTLRVTNDRNASGYARQTVSVIVGNYPPVARLTVDPTTVLTFETVTADGSGSYDPDGYSGYLTYRIDWGDGNSSLSAKATHAYAEAGAYSVTLTVTDYYGAQGTASQTVTVKDRPPVASFTYDPLGPTVERVIHFDASGSNDADGSVVSYAWSFGDGASGSGVVATHSYATVGTYAVGLTVTDDSGHSASTSRTATVTGRALVIDPSGSFDYGAKENVRIKVIAVVKDANTMVPVSNATVIIQVYDDAGNPWASGPMVEKLAGTGIYEWQSSGTIRDMGIKKGIYTAKIQASYKGGPVATGAVPIHVDPPPQEIPFYMQPVVVGAFLAGALVAAGLVAALQKRRRRS